MLQHSPLWSFIKQRKLCLQLMVVYNLANLFIGAVFYFMLPIILNYSPNFIARNHQLTGVLYHHQFLIILSLIGITGSIALFVLLKDINLHINSLPNNFLKTNIYTVCTQTFL